MHIIYTVSDTIDGDYVMYSESTCEKGDHSLSDAVPSSSSSSSSSLITPSFGHHSGPRAYPPRSTYEYNDIISAITIAMKMNGDSQYITSIADAARYANVPWRTVMRWLAMAKDPSKGIPGSLPRRGKPPLINSTAEIGLASWCIYEADCQRSVTISLIKEKAKMV